MTAALSRHVQLTRELFLRALPEAIDQRPFHVSGDVIEVDATDNGHVQICLTTKSHAGSAERAAPALQVDFTFQNMTDDEARLFMQSFDAHEMMAADT